MIENRSPRFFYGYIIVTAALFIMAVMWGAIYTFGIFLKPVSAEFGWSRAAISGAYSLFMVVHGLLYIITGRLNDRFGPRLVMTVCGIVMGLGYLLMSQISGIWQLYLFYGVIIGIGMSGVFVPLTSTIARWFVSRRGLMTGIALSGGGVGTLIMPPIANWLITNYGWQVSYIIIGGIILVLVILAAQFLRRDPSQKGLVAYGVEEAEVGNLDSERGFSLQEAIHTRQFWMFGAAFFCFGFYLHTIMVHIAPHATEFGISTTIAASLLSVIGGVGIAGRIALGGTGDRIGNRLVAIVCFFVMFVALSCLVVAREAWAFYLVVAVFGFAYGGFDALISPIVAELFGLSSHGVILGSLAVGATIGGAIGPVLAGRIFDVTGSYNLAFLICAVTSIIALALVLLLTPASSKGRTND